MSNPKTRPYDPQEAAMAQLLSDPDDFDRCLASLIAEGSFPSFDEFRKNPDKWRESPTALFEAIDRSTVLNRKDLAKQKLYWRYGKESFSLEKLEKICLENGYSLRDVDVIPFRSQNTSGTGKDEMFVRVFPKNEMRVLGAVVPDA